MSYECWRKFLFQGFVLLFLSFAARGWAAVPLAEAVATVERTMNAHPLAEKAGPAATGRYVVGLVSSALAVFEQSRHLDKPWIARNDAIDGRPGLVNPDNLYASALLSPNGSYRIHGRRGSHVQLSLQILDAYPNVSLGRNLAVIDLDRLGIRAGEPFELFLGGARRDGHWFALPPGAQAILIRQTFADWPQERPSTLAIERLDAGAPASAEAEHSATVGDYVLRTAKTWNEGYLPQIQQLPVNRLLPPRPSDPAAGGLGGQQSVMGRYRLAPGQALVVTAPRTAAPYQAIQLGDPWFVTANFVDRQVSLTQAQASVDGDGRIRYVISLEDPGVANWLDAAGFAEGYIFMRWQGLGRDLLPEEAPTAEIVPLAELSARLPPETRRVTAAARAAQLAQRLYAPIRQR